MSSLSLAAETKRWMGGDAECGQRRGSFGDGSHARSLTATRRPDAPATIRRLSLQTTMVRQLKHHEQKLLKKVDFLNVCFSPMFFCHILIFLQWKQDANLREIKVMRRYHIQDREDYHK